MVIESPVPQEQPLAASADPVKPSYLEAHTTPPESAPMAAVGDSTVNGVDVNSEVQRQQQGGNMPNGVHGVYPYPYPPPGAMYHVPPPELYQGASGPRMVAPAPYPYPPPQQGQHLPPPNGFAFPTMMAPPGNNGASPTSPTGPPAQYPFMWYAPPGMPMPPPPSGMVSQNGLPVPMNSSLPPPSYPPHPSQNQGDAQTAQHPMENDAHPQQQQQQQQQRQQQQQPQSGDHPSGAGYPPGPGGLPPKEVAKTIPCRYFPDCRFGASCWFLHPGAESSNQTQDHPQQENQASRPYFSGPLPPPVRYGPSGPWDPSATPTTNGAAPDANKNAPPAANNASTYGLMYAPYPYPNGYPTPYAPPQQQATPAPAASVPQSPPQAPQHISPQHYPQSLQQGPPSQSQSPSIPTPSTGIPVMYAPNSIQGHWYPAPSGSYPPQNMPMQNSHHGQPLSPSQQTQNMGPLPMSPISPSMGPGPVPVQSMGMSQPMSPVGPPMHFHQNSVPYPISPPYTSPRVHSKSPSQVMHPLSPQTHPGSPQSSYGHQQPAPAMPVMPGHHSRRESMSSMSAVPMGAVLGARLDGNTNADATRSPPSAFREMDGGFPRRGRGGHSQRGSWGGNGFGPSRKPPCAFFPAGKCKNGDQCRFPHVIPDENTHISPISPRGGYPGPFGRMANGRRPTILGPIEDKMGDLSVKEQNENIENPEAGPRSAGVSKQFSSSPKVRPSRAPLSTPSTPINRQNAHLQSHQQTPSQRLPSADDFPVLTGSATPPSGNGATYGGAWSGPTAAQVLKGIGAKKGTNASGTTPENGKEVKATSENDHLADDPFRAPDKATNGSTLETLAN